MANEYFWGQKKDGTWGLGGDTTEFQPGSITGAIGNYNADGSQTSFGRVGQANVGLGDSLYLGQTPEYWQKFGAGGGMVGDDSVAGQALASQVATDTSKDFMGMNSDQWGNAMKAGQLGLGAGQLGLGILGYFENKGLADKQKQVLNQQIESNRAEIDARKNYRSALEKF